MLGGERVCTMGRVQNVVVVGWNGVAGGRRGSNSVGKDDWADGLVGRLKYAVGCAWSRSGR